MHTDTLPPLPRPPSSGGICLTCWAVGWLLHQPVGDVPACGFTGPDNLHHLRQGERKAGRGLALPGTQVQVCGGGGRGRVRQGRWRPGAALALKRAGVRRGGSGGSCPRGKVLRALFPPARRALSPALALSQSSEPQGLQPGSWAAGSLGVCWEAQSGKKPCRADWEVWRIPEKRTREARKDTIGPVALSPPPWS